MKYLGSPITTVPKLDENLEQGENQAEEILGESMEFSLEDQEEVKVKCSLMVSLHFHIPSFLNQQSCIFNMLQSL